MLGLRAPEDSAMSIGGFMQAAGNAAIDKTKAKDDAAAAARFEPVVEELAGHIRSAWTRNHDAKREVNERMIRALRQRQGKYDPETLRQIRQIGGSEVYMRIVAAKCRGVSAWLRDVLLANGSERPWELDPTPMPELPPDKMMSVREEMAKTVAQLGQAGMPINVPEMRRLLEMRKHQMLGELRSDAKAKAEQMERYMEDQLVEGGFQMALAQFIDDLTTFPAAILKGPIIRKRRKLAWVQGAEGWEAKDEERFVPEWERVSPFDLYPSPQAESVNEGELIEKHRLSRAELKAMVGVEGYSEEKINTVLEEYGEGGLVDWTDFDSEREDVEEKSDTSSNPDNLIDALQYWGSVQGKMLIEWGMDEKDIPDPLDEYEIEAWLIGTHVIKAVVNPDPLNRRPYFKTSFETVPGTFWGIAVPDLIEDVENMCNATARALSNNMGIASGPQAWIDVDRLAVGEDVTNLFPWKIWQVRSDTTGANAKPLEFFQPGSNAQELMAVYEKFSVLADEYSGVPRYMTGESPTGSVGRTASGLSMLMGHAGKIMKQVVANIDTDVFSPLLERLHGYNMRYSDDETVKGDVRVIARGINSLTMKETAQVRRNEFLAATANQFDMNIIGPNGRAAVLREVAKTLDMNVDRVVPDPDMLAAQQQLAQLMAPPMPAGSEQAPGSPQQPKEAAPQQGNGQGPSQSGQQLMDGAPQQDNFQPPNT